MITKNMADVCEEAHNLTDRECKRLGYEIDCSSQSRCGDWNELHESKEETHYSRQAQDIFERFYNELMQKYNL